MAKPLQLAAMLLAAFAVGMYFGGFMAEAGLMYQCERYKHAAFKGAFWKDGIVYNCTRIAFVSAPEGETK